MIKNAKSLQIFINYPQGEIHHFPKEKNVKNFKKNTPPLRGRERGKRHIPYLLIIAWGTFKVRVHVGTGYMWSKSMLININYTLFNHHYDKHVDYIRDERVSSDRSQ